jgi:hypothetical protein
MLRGPVAADRRDPNIDCNLFVAPKWIIFGLRFNAHLPALTVRGEWLFSCFDRGAHDAVPGR